MPTKSDKRVLKAEFRFLRAGHEARERAGIVAPGVEDFPQWLPTASPRFTWNKPFQVVICEKLDQVTCGKVKRMMLLAPPRHGKSEMTTVHYVAWRIIRDPTIRVIIGCYGKKLANKFSRQIRRLVKAAGVELSKERNSVEEWETIDGGALLAVSKGAIPTGFGANLIVIDDWIADRLQAESEIHRDNAWELYKGLCTRLEPDAAIVFMNTRWHTDDVPGRLLEAAEQGGEQWVVVKFPALAKEDDAAGRKPGEPLWPERYPEETLLEIKRDNSSAEWSSTYDQEPVPTEGALFKVDWFKDSLRDTYPDNLRWVRYWDLAVSVKSSADFTASCAVAFDGDGCLWIRDMVRGRWEWPDAKRQIIKTMLLKSEARTTHGIEKAMHGLAAVQSLMRDRRLVSTSFRGIDVVKDKYSRALSWSDRAEAGKVRLVKGPWIPEFLKELTRFTGKGDTHDDQVDSVSGGALMIAGKRSAKAY